MLCRVLDGIETQLLMQKPPVKLIRIDGSTPPHLRSKYNMQFQQRPDIEVALLSIKAAGVGLSFVSAAHCIFAELLWTPGHCLQAEDRICRLGQRASEVFVDYILAPPRVGTDETVWSTVASKLDTLQTALDGNGAAAGDEAEAAPEVDPHEQKLLLDIFDGDDTPSQGAAPAAAAQPKRQTSLLSVVQRSPAAPPAWGSAPVSAANSAPSCVSPPARSFSTAAQAIVIPSPGPAVPLHPVSGAANSGTVTAAVDDEFDAEFAFLDEIARHL